MRLVSGLLDISPLIFYSPPLEMNASLVGAPGFKPACLALTLSWVGSIPTHLRHGF